MIWFKSLLYEIVPLYDIVAILNVAKTTYGPQCIHSVQRFKHDLFDLLARFIQEWSVDIQNVFV